MFKNIPPVTKNLLLLNIMFFVVSFVLAMNQIHISDRLGAHYFNSVLFEPFQVVTHMFMHSIDSPFHIFFNMFLLVMFGGHLERVWGSKKYFVFYIASGLGALVLYNTIGMYEIIQLKNTILSEKLIDIDTFNNVILDNAEKGVYYEYSSAAMTQYELFNRSTMIGASGAIFGLLAGFAMLFPNTELMLLFPPIPIKAKYLIGGYLVFEIYSSLNQSNDNVAHLAHVGGAVVGIILILVWRKRDRKNFW